MVMAKEIARGAEAVLYLDKKEGKTVLVKDRVKKGYRLPELDGRIRRQRTRHEDSLLDRARRAGVAAPRVFETSRNELVMEFIEGPKVKDVFNELGGNDREAVCSLIGEALGKLHSAHIVHGDFTTSNMILKNKSTHEGGRRLKWGEKSRPAMNLYVIDLGLGKYSQKVEDHAVDLYLLYEALKAAHFKYLNEAWQKILKSYRQHYTQAPDVLKRLEKIEKRRRYKHG
jgi:Kae1-associated kinase Bud32